MKMGWDVSVLLGSHFTPTPCFRTLYLDVPGKMKKTIITQNILVTQCSSIVALWLVYPETYMCRYSSLFKLFPCSNWCFFIFCQEELRKQPKFHILLILSGKSASKLLEWHVYRVWCMPNPMALV